MFDGLTRDELYELHSKLHDEGRDIHQRIMALPSTLGDEAGVLMAKHAEISETMRSVYVEIDRRDQDARNCTSPDHDFQIEYAGCCDICGTWACQVRDA